MVNLSALCIHCEMKRTKELPHVQSASYQFYYRESFYTPSRGIWLMKALRMMMGGVTMVTGSSPITLDEIRRER
jgi:hypothetical protein